MQKELKELIKLAEDFREFSQMTTGWQSKYYCNNKVWCYFSDSRNHSAVYIDDIEINFFSPVQITCTYSRLTKNCIANLVKEYRIKLDVLKTDYQKKTKVEIQAEKAENIKALKESLAELEEENE